MNVIAFIISLALFVGGIVILGYSFSVVGYELPVFFGGILVTSLGVAIPIHLLKRIDA
jgi:hypothetical protein